MTDEDRARDYIKIFIAAGDEWRGCIPLDARVTAQGAVWIGSVELVNQGDGVWSLNDGSTVTRYRRAVAS